jgi:TonB family protein
MNSVANRMEAEVAQMPASMQEKPEKTGELREIVVTGYAAPQTPVRQKPATTPITAVEVLPEFVGGESALMEFIFRNLDYPVSAQQNGIQGRITCSFVIDDEGVIGHVKVLNSIDPAIDAEAVRVIRSMPRWKPARLGGKPVAVEYTIPLQFRLEGGKTARQPASVTPRQTGIVVASTDTGKIVRINGDDPMKDVIFYIDGEVVTQDKFNILTPDKIESISVLKDQAAQNLHPGSKAGVIMVTTKRATESERKKTRELKSLQ